MWVYLIWFVVVACVSGWWFVVGLTGRIGGFRVLNLRCYLGLVCICC